MLYKNRRVFVCVCVCIFIGLTVMCMNVWMIAVDLVMQKRYANAFCVVRPPGMIYVCVCVCM